MNDAEYIARVFHANVEDRARHEAMGFYDDWGIVISQLESIAQGL